MKKPPSEEDKMLIPMSLFLVVLVVPSWGLVVPCRGRRGVRMSASRREALDSLVAAPPPTTPTMVEEEEVSGVTDEFRVTTTEDEEDEEEEEVATEFHVPSFLFGTVSSGVVAALSGAVYGRKLLFDRRAAEELKFAELAAEKKREAERLALEAQEATEAVEALETETSSTPVPQVATAYALLAWLRQRRNKPKIDSLRQIALEKTQKALEATALAEQTAQLTSLDLSVVDDLAKAELNYEREVDTNGQVDEALRTWDKAKQDALQVARAVLTEKAKIIDTLSDSEKTFLEDTLDAVDDAWADINKAITSWETLQINDETSSSPEKNNNNNNNDASSSSSTDNDATLLTAPSSSSRATDNRVTV